MPTSGTDKAIEESENNNEELPYWQPVIRKSSFTDINQVTLRNARNFAHTLGYVKEFRQHLNNEKEKINSIERWKKFQKRKSFRIMSRILGIVSKHIKDDWLCLALLGIFMALLSVGVDKGIELCARGNDLTIKDSNISTFDYKMEFICFIYSTSMALS